MSNEVESMSEMTRRIADRWNSKFKTADENLAIIQKFGRILEAEARAGMRKTA